MALKKMFIGGNWKCNGTLKKVQELVKMLNDAGTFPENAEVVVSPSALHAQYVSAHIRKDIGVAVQNIWTEAKAGAWTGELTPDLVTDLGIHWTILGHSERRKYQEESPDLVAKKVRNALTAAPTKLKVIACIGETLEEREAGNTMKVCIDQLEPIINTVQKLSVASLDLPKDVVIAYEPVWAIGTGKVATVEQAQEVHAELRAWLSGKLGDQEAQKIRIIYGGSVNGANCGELMQGKDIDGFLVGGASLKKEFIDIIQSAQLKAKM